MPIYMKYGSLEGDVTVSGFEHWIEIDSLSWGVARPVTTPGTPGGKVSFSSINIEKILDKTSVALLASVEAGTVTSKVSLAFLKTTTTFAKVGSVEYLTYQLSDTLVSSYQVSSSGDVPQESLSLNFSKLQTTFMPQTGTSQTTTFDETKNQAS